VEEDEQLQSFFESLEDLHFNDDSSPSSSLVEPESHPSLQNMTFVYVISNGIYSQKNMFKIGKHKGTKKMLMKRYKTYLIEPIVYLFFPTGNASQDEAILLQRFTNYRVGGSEFIEMRLDDLMDKIYMYFKSKYKRRNPTVQIPYHRCIYQQFVYDFYEKTVTDRYVNRLKKCIFLPYLDLTEGRRNCLKCVDVRAEDKNIYSLDVEKLGDGLNVLMEHNFKNFIRCFLLEFDKRYNLLYLDVFLENGLNDFLMECMKQVYGYSSYKVLTRREFIEKECFPERLIFIKRGETNKDEPLEIVLEKLRYMECCIVIEDKNIYSIENCELFPYVTFQDFFYYFFYTL
jgi:hypothetical protein